MVDLQCSFSMRFLDHFIRFHKDPTALFYWLNNGFNFIFKMAMKFINSLPPATTKVWNLLSFSAEVVVNGWMDKWKMKSLNKEGGKKREI